MSAEDITELISEFESAKECPIQGLGHQPFISKRSNLDKIIEPGCVNGLYG